jgi:hypothetical protein
MPPFLLPLLGVIALALGLFGKRGGAAILNNLGGHGEESSGTKTEIHNHYYQGSGPRAEEEEISRSSDAPAPIRVKRRMRRDPPRTLDLNPYEDEREADGHDGEVEKEAKP